MMPLAECRAKKSLLQRGFAAIAAIFLVVVLAALGAFMLSLSNSQQVTSAQDTLGTRAYWAARAGMEWAVVAGPGVCPAANITLAALVAGVGPAGIDGFTITIRCSRNDYTEAGVTRTLYRFESTASMGSGVGSVGYVERSVTAGVEQ
jgi:MSHA biogenesis protein MshP